MRGRRGSTPEHSELADSAASRLTFLLHASNLLTAHLDFRDTLDGLVDLVVSELADWCTIMLPDDQGRYQRMAVAHSQISAEPLMEELRSAHPPSREVQPALFKVIDSGSPVIISSTTSTDLDAITTDGTLKRLLLELDTGSLLIVPILKQEEVMGAIFMARRRARPAFAEEDVEIAMELGRQSAVALENARLHERTRELNDELERRVEERTAELERMNASLEEANRRLEEQIEVRSETEAELRKRERQLQRAQRITQLGSWSWRPQSGNLEWSKETYRIFGLDSGTDPSLELYLDHIPAEEREYVRTTIESALREVSAFSFEHAVLREDGNRSFVRCEGEVTADESGAVSEMFGTILDITGDKEVEQAIRASEERFRFLAENSLHIIATIHRDGTIRYMSPSSSQVLGRAPEELVGRSYLEFAHPDDLEVVRRKFRGLLERPGIAQQFQLRYLHSSGEWRVLELQGQLPSDDTEHAIVNGYDVTDRLRAEGEIRALNTQLRRRTEQLSATNRELESFAYSVSHDLRAPLRSVDGFSRALEEDYGSQLDAGAASYIERIRAAAVRMGRLIDDLLSLSRLARKEIVREPVDLSELAHQVGEEFARTRSREVDLRVHDDLHCHGDVRLLTVLLENLLDNAWKFTRKVAEPTVWVGSLSSDGEEVFFVRDNGAGFEMEHAERMFGAFQRLHTDSEFEGTGIGLATVQRIVNRHGGRIWAEGRVDEGATIYFTLGSDSEQ